MKKELSKCCSAPVTTSGKGDFHDQDEVCTMYNSCEACKQPCDVRPQKPSERINELVRLREVEQQRTGMGGYQLDIRNWFGSVLDYLDEQAELNNQKP